MSDAANVRSIEAIDEFRGELIRFHESASIAMSSMQMQIKRVMQWLEHDRPNYWRKQIQLGHRKLEEARVDLTRCRMRRTGDIKPSCFDEQKALNRAKARLDTAYEKAKLVRRWIVKAQHEVDEFNSHTAQFSHTLGGEVPRMLALLERITRTLEQYVTAASIDVGPGPDASESRVAKETGCTEDEPEPADDSR